MPFHKKINLKLEYIILAVVILTMSYMFYDVIVNSKEYYCGCGSHKVEGFCGNLFSENCKSGCPQGFTSYAMPGIQSRNKRMSVNLENLELGQGPDQENIDIKFEGQSQPIYDTTDKEIHFPSVYRVDNYSHAY